MQIAPTTADSIKPLLRPDAAAEAQKDIRNAEAKLESPHIEDKREARNQLIRLRKTAVQQLPKPPESAEQEGQMLSRSQALLEHIVNDGMLSQAEMRACPPGAPDRHLAWERRHKAEILEWKNLQLRLRPGEREAANLERHRPTLSSMNLDNAVVERKMMFNVDQVATVAVVFSDAELIALESLSKDDHARIASMSNDERSIWKRLIAAIMSKAETPKVAAEPVVEKKPADKPVAVKKTGKREWTEEQKQAARDRMANARAAKGSKKTE